MNFIKKIPNFRKINKFVRQNFLAKTTIDSLVGRLYLDYETIDKSPKPKGHLLATLKKGVTVLEEMGIAYSIGRGTLLGLHRDGSFTKGDNDIDIDMFDDKMIYELIAKLPFDLVLINIASGRYQQLVMVDPKTNVLFDIWFYSLIRNKYINRHVQGYFKIPKNKVDNLKSTLLEGISYSCFDPKWYCKYWYGKSWNIPIEYSKTWIQFYKEDCSGFEFKPIKNYKSVDCLNT